MSDNISSQDAELIAEYCHHLEHEMNRSTHTIRSYRSDLLGLASDLQTSTADHEVSSPVFYAVTLEQLRNWLAQLTRHGMSRVTLARKITSVRQFMSWLVRQDIREDNPAARLLASKTASHLPDTLSQAQIQEVLDRLKSRCEETEGTKANPLALRDLAMVEVLYSTGIQLAELEARYRVSFPISCQSNCRNKQRMVPLTVPAVGLRRLTDTWSETVTG